MPPFPTDDAPDLALVLEAQKKRTPEVLAEAKRDEKFEYPLFESVYGAGLSKEKAPKFNELLKNVLATTRVVNATAKNKYKRPRPYQNHPEVQPLFQVNGFSYPSGHSMGSYALATVLAAIFPDKKQALLDRAAEIAQSRVNAGVHNPSDIKEGEVLGKATGAALLANASSQKDLAGVKAEVKR